MLETNKAFAANYTLFFHLLAFQHAQFQLTLLQHRILDPQYSNGVYLLVVTLALSDSTHHS